MAKLFNKKNTVIIIQPDTFIDTSLFTCKRNSKAVLISKMESKSYSKDHLMSFILSLKNLFSSVSVKNKEKL